MLTSETWHTNVYLLIVGGDGTTQGHHTIVCHVWQGLGTVLVVEWVKHLCARISCDDVISQYGSPIAGRIVGPGPSPHEPYAPYSSLTSLSQFMEWFASSSRAFWKVVTSINHSITNWLCGGEQIEDIKGIKLRQTLRNSSCFILRMGEVRELAKIGPQ
ncbi:hypothetical protein E2C01_049375 [Portunus trituberculatus]|uniref:Uncharacterized protein n=1 Tax=Portunus trituberculatus TaxID=210409 RepID=A0A5B7G5E1_PORTR|nr:hypothetical protein [Portunus trituberculatus]